MSVITGFNITRNGQFGSGVYTNEAEAIEKLGEYREKNPNDQFYLQPVNIYIPEDKTHFDYKRYHGQWHLEQYMGMGESSHFQMSDEHALSFAESVYEKLGKIPGDLIKADVEVRLDLAARAIEQAKRSLES